MKNEFSHLSNFYLEVISLLTKATEIIERNPENHKIAARTAASTLLLLTKSTNKSMFVSLMNHSPEKYKIVYKRLLNTSAVVGNNTKQVSMLMRDLIYALSVDIPSAIRKTTDDEDTINRFRVLGSEVNECFVEYADIYSTASKEFY